ncbi:MAG: phenylalanine--tRNA ligase subunit beta [Pseudomonadota bacterium]
MKFTLDWLKSHLDTDASLDDICDALTDIGLEVESVEDPAAKFAAFTIAHVKDAVKHPDADKLRVCTVETVDGEKQIVCGAPNVRAGMTAVYAPVGAYVPGIDVTLTKAKIRGVESFGMLASERELELSDEHDGIMDLDAGPAVGTPVAEVLGLTDPVIDIAITPDRADCLGVRGIARDLAARGLGTLKPYDIPKIKGEGSAQRAIILDFPAEKENACPYFAGHLVRGVKNGPSPEWMQKRLNAIGSKPISALVDMTNYVSFDLGRPLHVFDAAKLTGDIRARLARDGETLNALNEKTYTLTPDMTVIADDSGALGLGGVMGGMESAVSDETTDVFIESAWFDPIRTGQTGRSLSIESDARYRFERGVDPAFVDDGLAVATQMVLDLCGGTPSEITSAGTPPLRGHCIDFDPAQVEKLAGVTVEDHEALEILSDLGFGFVGESAPYKVYAPEWRADIDGSADLVEEVIRIKGLGHVPTTPLPRQEGVATPTLVLRQKAERTLRRRLAASGLTEAITYAFISENDAAPFAEGRPLQTLANAISSDMTTMRPSLLPGLVRAAQRNLDRGQASVRLFEIGRAFRGEGPKEQPLQAAAIIAGHTSARSWRGAQSPVDSFDAKALALEALSALGAPIEKLQTYARITGDDMSPAYHPGQSGELRLGPKNTLARFGVIHPKCAAHFGITAPTALLEVFIENAPGKKKSGTTKAALNAQSLQPVERDFAFLVDEAQPAQTLMRAIAGADKKAIAKVQLFDRYQGKGLEPGTVSLGVCVTLQPNAASFTDKEIEAISAKIIAAAEKSVGAQLRA